MDRPIYLDGFSTTLLDPNVRDSMVIAWLEPANTASPHYYGAVAARAVDSARSLLADAFGCGADELILTSGATEANNMAIRGGAEAYLRSGGGRRKIVVSAIEHKSVLESAHAIASLGFETIIAPVTKEGVLDLNAFAAIVTDDCWMAAIMAVNNETGAVQPVVDAVRIAHAAGALFHCDAVQAAGKIPVDFEAWEVDSASLSSHKVRGPIGVGALFCAAGTPLPDPLIVGGGQQRGLRSGTEPVPLIIGFAQAARAAVSGLQEKMAKARGHEVLFLDELRRRQLLYSQTTGDGPRVPGGLSLCIVGVDAEELVMRCQNKVAFSTGSACSSGQIQQSHVLLAMGLGDLQAQSCFRVLLDDSLSSDDVMAAAGVIAETALSLQIAAGRTLQ